MDGMEVRREIHMSPAVQAALAACPTQVVVATGGGSLTVLEVAGEGLLIPVATASVGAEVACVDITPIGE